ncbi:hypothetical protein QA597_11765, partial [Marinilabiliaceae bacterium ANBcel2]|nr:hypothetical protein [Marinilabiliaceae bacterium ANBcel2]
MLLKDTVNYYAKYNFLFKKYLSDLDELDPDKILEKQNDLFRSLLKKAKRSKFYQLHYSNYGVDLNRIKTIEDIKELPTIDKQLIKNNVDQLWVGGAIKFKGYTSGTSGSPLLVYRSLKSIIKEQAYVW